MAKTKTQSLDTKKHFWVWALIGLLWGFGLMPAMKPFPESGLIIGVLLGLGVGIAVHSYAQHRD